MKVLCCRSRRFATAPDDAAPDTAAADATGSFAQPTGAAKRAKVAAKAAAQSVASNSVLLDSSDLYASGAYGELRARLLQDGFLFLRGVVNADVVAAAREEFSKCMPKSSKRSGSAALAFDALTGVKSSTQQKSSLAQAAGNSAAMQALYCASVKKLCENLCTVEPAAADAHAGKAERAPSFTRMPECTWMRVVSKSGKTPQHSDLMFFLRQTNRLLEVYQRAPHHQLAVAAAAIAQRTARSASAANEQQQPRECSAEGCKSSASAELVACAACKSLFHPACQPSLLSWGDLPLHRWHCSQCVNAPSPFYTCWMPLTDLSAESSRLQVLPASHRQVAGYERMLDIDGGDVLPGDYTEAKAAELKSCWVTAPADMKAGDVILFNWKLIHAATAHTDTDSRLSVDTRIAMHALQSC